MVKTYFFFARFNPLNTNYSPIVSYNANTLFQIDSLNTTLSLYSSGGNPASGTQFKIIDGTPNSIGGDFQTVSLPDGYSEVKQYGSYSDWILQKD